MSTLRNPLTGSQVDRSRIVNVGVDLQRPECILAERDGTIWTADARGVMRIASDGTQTLIRQQGVADRELTASRWARRTSCCATSAAASGAPSPRAKCRGRN